MNKLFVVTRGDLPPGAIAAQSVHAGFAFAHEHQFEWRTWLLGSNNIVLLSVPDEPALLELAQRAQMAGVSVSLNREPDFGNSLTAIAIGPAGRKLVSSLPKALRPPKESGAPRHDEAPRPALSRSASGSGTVAI